MITKNTIRSALRAAIALTAVAALTGTAWAQTGMPDIGWYTANPSATSFAISTADQLAGLAEIVNETCGVGNAMIRYITENEITICGIYYIHRWRMERENLH